MILGGEGDLDAQLDRACADGRITTGDADEVRNFADFLRATAGIPTRVDERTEEQNTAWWAAYTEHYPEEAASVRAQLRAERDRATQDGARA